MMGELLNDARPTSAQIMTLQFDMTDPDAAQAARRAMKADDMAAVLHEIENNVRKRLSGRGYDESDDSHNTLNAFYDMFADEMMSKGININDLIS